MRRNTLINNGSALIAALVMAAVMTLIAGNAFIVLQQRYRTTNQTMSWQEALLTAEAGVDLAMSQIRQGANGNASEAWDGWEIEDTSGNFETAGFTSTTTATLLTSSFVRTTEGGNKTWSKVIVTAPLQDSNGENWYKIRSIGISEVPGGQVLSGDTVDVNLRKTFFHYNKVLDQQIENPQAVRVVEVIAKPIGAFSKALVSNGSLDMNNHNIVVDSYDSLDSTKSTNGQYDSTKRGEKGDIATNGKVIDAGNAHIYGDASTNGGTVLGSQNVTGEITDDFYQDLPYVHPPDWCNSVTERNSPQNFANLEVDGEPGIQAGTTTTTRILVDDIDLKKVFTLHGVEDPAGEYVGSDGKRYKKSYIEIVALGDIDIGGNGEIVVEPGVFVRIFGEQDIVIAGNGFLNEGTALQLQVYGSMNLEESEDYLADGIEPAERIMKIAGNGGFCGSAYAPLHAIELKGGGNTDSIYGAFAGKTIFMNGVQSVHYDEQLSNGGLISDYRIISWLEDIDLKRETWAN